MKLTENFELSEFASKCGRPMPVEVMNNVEMLAQNLQVIRDLIGQPITINSGYRSPEHNASDEVKGAKNSFHVKGMAADLSARHISPSDLAHAIEDLMDEGKIEKGGIGLYKTFVHYDIRGFKRKW
jgi:uncharacterized protein YcbK (DUF882 family)